MNNFRLTSKFPVDFVAKSLFQQKIDKTYAHLMNGMLCSYCSSNGVCTELFDGARFCGASFNNETCYLIDWNGLLSCFNYDLERLQLLSVYEGAIDPIFVDEELQVCVFHALGLLVSTDMKGRLLTQWSLPFKPYSMVRIDRSRFCIGGSGLCIIDTVSGEMDSLDGPREIPFFDLSYDPGTQTVAAAGFTELCVFDLVVKSKKTWIDLPARYCQFAPNSELWLSYTSSSDDGIPVLSHFVRHGLQLNAISHGAFCFASKEAVSSRLIVSALDFLYEFTSADEA